MAAIMAAIMSTADSLLLQTGSVASRDLYQRFIRRDASEREMVWVARVLVAAVGIVGYAVAVFEPPAVFDVVVFVTSVLGSAFLPCYVCAVWWRKANAAGAVASMIGGATTAFLWEALDLAAATGLHAMLAGLGASIPLMVIVSLVTQRRSPVPDGVVRAIDDAAGHGVELRN
jgi:sodium/proline symporter